MNEKESKIKKEYPNISNEEAKIIASYTFGNAGNKYNPYTILNKNLVSDNRQEGIANVPKYLYILLSAITKLKRFYPENKELYRCITVKVKVEVDNDNRDFVPYIKRNIKTFWDFSSTSIEKKISEKFLDNKKRIGTFFTLGGDIWGYDIHLFNI